MAIQNGDALPVNPIVERVGPGGATTLVGLLGPGVEAGQYRKLYRDPSLDDWYDVLKEDIIASLRIAEGGEHRQPRDILWVKPAARILHCTRRNPDWGEPVGGRGWPTDPRPLA
jgi:hypothetical protein